MAYLERNNTGEREYLTLELLFAWISQRLWLVVLYIALAALLAQWGMASRMMAVNGAGFPVKEAPFSIERLQNLK